MIGPYVVTHNYSGDKAVYVVDTEMRHLSDVYLCDNFMVFSLDYDCCYTKDFTVICTFNEKLLEELDFDLMEW